MRNTSHLTDWPASALSALRQQEDQAAVREGIADMEAARVLTLHELDARIQARLTTQPPE